MREQSVLQKSDPAHTRRLSICEWNRVIQKEGHLLARRPWAPHLLEFENSNSYQSMFMNINDVCYSCCFFSGSFGLFAFVLLKNPVLFYRQNIHDLCATCHATLLLPWYTLNWGWCQIPPHSESLVLRIFFSVGAFFIFFWTCLVVYLLILEIVPLKMTPYLIFTEFLSNTDVYLDWLVHLNRM